MQVVRIVAPMRGEYPAGEREQWRADLAAVCDMITATFDGASLDLVDAVAALDGLLGGLGDVVGALAGDVGREAVAGLRAAAGGLAATPELVRAREGDFMAMRRTASGLQGLIDQASRCLRALDAYGLNLKVTASGLPQFAALADAMRARLGEGQADLEHLTACLEVLDAGLAGMALTDASLIAECRRVVPQVPEALRRDAEDLEAQNARLVALAQQVSIDAYAARGEVHAALGAIQIGDRVRQRLEHVLAGLGLIDELAANEPIGEAVSSAVTAILAAQCEQAAAEFAAETVTLANAIDRLRRRCGGLIDHLTAQASGAGGGAILARILQSVSDAQGMLGQLQEAALDGVRTQDMIVRAAGEVANRAAALGNLRLDVQLMAINASIGCRSAPAVARPVNVIATEIHAFSNRLDAMVSAVHESRAKLTVLCGKLRADGADEAAGATALLATFTETIVQCQDDHHRALDAAGAAAALLPMRLASASGKLEGAAGLSRIVRTAAQAMLRDLTPAMLDAEVLPLAQTVVDRLARTYTMAEERAVHDAALAPGLVPIALTHQGNGAVNCESADVDEDDDGLF